jgi:hypothetical protein
MGKGGFHHHMLSQRCVKVKCKRKIERGERERRRDRWELEVVRSILLWR